MIITWLACKKSAVYIPVIFRIRATKRRERNVHLYENYYITFKGARSYFAKFSFLFHLNNHHSNKFQILVETDKPFGCTKQFCILQLPISYCLSLIMVTITKHVFINIFQTEHFSAVKFAMGYGKIWTFLW